MMVKRKEIQPDLCDDTDIRLCSRYYSMAIEHDKEPEIMIQSRMRCEDDEKF